MSRQKEIKITLDYSSFLILPNTVNVGPQMKKAPISETRNAQRWCRFESSCKNKDCTFAHSRPKVEQDVEPYRSPNNMLSIASGSNQKNAVHSKLEQRNKQTSINNTFPTTHLLDQKSAAASQYSFINQRPTNNLFTSATQWDQKIAASQYSFIDRRPTNNLFIPSHHSPAYPGYVVNQHSWTNHNMYVPYSR